MKKILISAVTGMAIAIIPASAFACDFTLKGSGACQPNGSYNITWTVNNTDVNQEMTIVSSSNTTVVGAGTIIPAKKSVTFAQDKIDGTKAGSYELDLIGKWNGIKTTQIHSAKVTLNKPCAQPTPVTPPVTPPASVDASKVTTVSTPAVAQPATQVIAPVGAVNAGSEVKASRVNSADAIGLAGSVTVAGLGLRRLAKNYR